MKVLLRELQNDLYAKGITNKELAKKWGCSSGIVSDVFNEKTQMRFYYLSKTLINLYDDREIRRSKVKRYISIAKPRSLREAMEYLSSRGEFSLLKSVVESEIDSPNKENREWAGVYELILKRYTEKTKPKDFYAMIENKNRRAKTTEMQILTELLLCQALYQNKNYRSLFDRLSEVEKDINDIKNKFIKNSFMIRYKEAVGVISLQRGYAAETRSVCKDVINAYENDISFVIPYITAIGKLGESYFFEDYEKAKFFLEKGIALLDDFSEVGLLKKKEMFQYTLNFLKMFHLKDTEGLERLLGDAGMAYFRCRQGNYEEAEQLLMKIERKNGKLTSFETFYLGLARNDRELLKKSLEMFEESGNIFYSKLPKLYLGII
ncbi:AimR family lysis-lysogeny pheromone receptor [Bacillus mobilis]|uniref:AimR family lysis-lysogeny pheromone receptor n=1 Tax=Bacillus mobilis TaxID=2026190 RepID=UPI0036868812